MEIIEIYETASSDGYTDSGDRLYYLDLSIAKIAGRNKHKNYASGPIHHFAIKFDKDRYLILKSEKPVIIADTKTAIAEARKSALNKLNKEEQELLGLN